MIFMAQKKIAPRHRDTPHNTGQDVTCEFDSRCLWRINLANISMKAYSWARLIKTNDIIMEKCVTKEGVDFEQYLGCQIWMYT